MSPFFKKKKERKKEMLVTAPKKKLGKVKTDGHKMGNTFGLSPKKPEADMPPRTRAAMRSAREKRLQNRFI